MRRSDVLKAMARQLATRGDLDRLTQILSELHPADAAQVLGELPADQAAAAFSRLPLDQAADILAELPTELRQELLDRLQPDEVAAVVDQMQSDEAADVLQDMDSAQAEQVLTALRPETRQKLRDLIRYASDTAGGIMAKEFAAVPAQATASQAIELLRTKFCDVDNLNVVFAVDDQNRLVGSCSLRDIVLASPDTPVAELVERHAHWVQEHQDQEEVAFYMLRHGLDAVPVVDAQHRIIGQITLDDAADVVEEEAAEDIQRLSGITGDEHPFSPLLQSLRRRVPWLLINIPLALMAASVARLFSGTISKVPTIVAYLPIIGGIGGNAGGQTVAVFVRAIGLGQLEFKDFWRAVASEALRGLLVGLVTGVGVGLVAYCWEGRLDYVCVVTAALASNCLVACAVGAGLPLILRRLGWDPAMGSTLVDTAITDASGYALLLGTLAAAISVGLFRVVG